MAASWRGLQSAAGFQSRSQQPSAAVFGAAFAEIAERLRRSTVEVRLPNARGAGSGIIATADGRIVTNAHVAGGDAFVRLWDGHQLPATLIARDPRRDLAALQVAATGLPAVTFGDSNALRAGELVIAIGHPLGFIGALTTGVVHALGRLAGFGARNWVLADVRLAPGNSGGPLADAHGRVIGINTMIVNGLGAAVPANAITAFLRRGVSGYSLGVTIQPVRLEDQRSGLLIIKVEPGSPAASAPLWPGDVLIGAAGQPFRTVDDLHQALEDAGGRVRLQFLRGDRRATREVAIQLERGECRVAEAA